MLRKSLFTFLVLTGLSGTAAASTFELDENHARDTLPGVETTGQFSSNTALDLHVQTPPYQFLRLADASTSDTSTMGNDSMTHAKPSEAGTVTPEYKDRWFTANKVHKYLGIGSIALAALAVISPKDYDGAHENFARGAAALGGAAVATGLTFHFEDLTFKNATKNPDNQHALLGTLGAIGFGLAVSKGGESGHVGLGVAGGLAMLYAIKLTW